MLKHCYTLSVRSSEIYSTGEVSFHAEGASDQYFLGTQYLPPRWPTLSISTSILVLFHISSMIVGREEVLFAAPTLKWGSICCEANLKLLKYSLPLESYLGSSFSLSAMWANYCSFEKLYCIKIWQPIQTNVIYKILYFKQLVRNGYTEVGTCKPLMDYKWQRWRSRKRADLQGWQTRFLYHSSVFQNFRHIFDFAFPDMIWGGYGGLWIHFFHKLFQERGVGHLFCNLFYLIYLIVHSLYQSKPHVFPKIKVFTMWTPLKSILRRRKLWWKKPPGTPLLCLLLKQSENKTLNPRWIFQLLSSVALHRQKSGNKTYFVETF